MATLYTFCGISGSGKSTLSKDILKHQDAVRVSMDEWRKKLTGDISNQSRNADAYAEAWKEMKYFLAYSRDVVWDATNLNIADIKKLLQLAKEFGAELIVFVLHVSETPEVCRSRIQADLTSGVDRSKTADGDILERQHTKWVNTTKLLSSIEDPSLSVVHM